VTESGKALAQIVVSVKKVSDIVAEIAAASREQSSGIKQVNGAVVQMDQATQQNAALVEQVSATSQAVATQSRQLHDIVAGYRTVGSYEGSTVVARDPEAQTPRTTDWRRAERSARVA
jgi:methyl-accepting chemotaxis protein-1 (serine sensor receptor)